MSFNHFDSQGRAIMVDVSAKNKTMRTAIATARVIVSKQTLQAILDGGNHKGDVLGVARLAGISASKKTSDLIPLSHPLAIHHAAIDFQCDHTNGEILVTATIRAFERTGVEMEAMVSASLAALTIYDMCKGTDKAIRIENVALEFKEGGKSGTFRRAKEVGSPPVVSFCGWSGSGKTTLVEKVIFQLTQQGIKVGAIKHDGHQFEMDKEGKDSWRMSQAGAVTTVICDNSQQATFRRLDHPLSPCDVISKEFDDVDLVIIEGWKEDAPNRIEVYRQQNGRQPLCVGSETGFIAIASDTKVMMGLPQLDLNKPETVTNFIIKRFLNR